MGIGSFYTITAPSGIEATLSTLGACIMSVKTPDRDGKFGEITLGFDTPEEMRDAPMTFGVTIGRVANRIGGAKFTLGDKTYVLPANEGPNQIHGGPEGFSSRVWNLVSHDDSRVVFGIDSPDGDMGYPGNLRVTAAFELSDNALTLTIRAVTDADTVVNMTNHAYWNLSGFTRDVLAHELQIESDTYTPSGFGLIPTGEFLPIADTPLDFREPHTLGERISETQFGGYDNNYVLRGDAGTLRRAARLYDASTGRVLTLCTNQHSVQLYSGNGIPPTHGHGGVEYSRYWGVALEPQSPPDAPNRPEFPSIVLREGEVYEHVTEYEFN
ncbi:MAG: galactose mutarotase [Oscillospiraceae bacterium]|jgi:aldose 1-epimerase|nr:galactose mutarotase [Oscillospiraceae bacterium]